jgi:hypothetical protein
VSGTRASRRAERTRSASWFWWALAGVAAVGLAVRLAYILGFRANVRANPDFKGYSWNTGKLTPASERAQAWERRGGPLGRLGRATVRGCREITRRARRVVGRIVRG